MPRPEEFEVAELFLRKAASDLSAARALAGDPDQRDDVIGFHAQQAVEKAMKAVLAVRGFEIPRTHDVVLLLRLIETSKEKPPEHLEEAKSLAPWAVAMRYDEMDSTLDRASALAVADVALNWAEAVVDAARAQRTRDGG